MRGRELRKGNVSWCCCCGLCSGSALAVKHLAQPEGVLGMVVSEMSLVHAAACGKSSWRSCQLGNQRGEGEDNTALETELCVRNVRGTGATLAQIPNSAGQTSHQRIRSVIEVMCILSVIKRLCSSG